MLLIICDRQFNIKDEVLINNINPAWDIVTPYKNKLILPSKPNIDEGNILLFKRNSSIDFVGFATEIKLDKGICEISYYHISEIFNSEIPMANIVGSIYNWVNFLLYANYAYSPNYFDFQLLSNGSRWFIYGYQSYSIENGGVTGITDNSPLNSGFSTMQRIPIDASTWTLNALFSTTGTAPVVKVEIEVYNQETGGTLLTSTSGNFPKTFTINQPGFLVLRFYADISTTEVKTVKFENISLNKGQDTTYYPYVGVRDKLSSVSHSLTNGITGFYPLDLEFDKDGNFKQALDKVYGITGTHFDYDIDFSSGKPSALKLTVKNNNDKDYKIIRHDLPIISDIKINYAKQKYNKVIIRPESGIGATYYRYLLKDGAITDNETNPNRFNYVVQTIKYYTNVSDIDNIAKETMGGNESNHNIEFNILKNSSYDLSMYDRIVFIYYDQIFYSTVTRIEDYENYKKITIGIIRLRLSEKLKAAMQY